MPTQQSKEDRFAALLETDKRRLMAIARSYASSSERDDLYQEILLALWRGLEGFRGHSSPHTWVYRVALNTAISYHRKRRVRERHIDADAPSEAASESVAEGGPELSVLREFMAGLNRVNRAVLLLYLEDQSYRDIADITGLSEANVGVKLNRMKNALKAHLGL